MPRGSMKTAVSLPDQVFEEAEALAKQLGISRSKLYAKALKAYLRKRSLAQISDQLNQIYADELSELDSVLTQLQLMSLPKEDW